jgi:signal transduction histidine kinase
MEENIEDFALRKRHKLFERITLFATIMGIFHFAQDLISVEVLIPVIDALITAVLFGCYVFHRKGYHDAARYVGLTFLNLCFAVYACIIPASVGVYLFYLPLIVISMAIFGSNERKQRNFFVLLSAALLVSLFLFDFNLIGDFELTATDIEYYFIVNLLSSTFILIVSVGFILSVNAESERRLHVLANEVKIQNHHLEKTNAELDSFFYSTSHDLRSPLLSIKGLVNIALNESNEPKIRSYLGMMDGRVDKLDTFIKEIIDYSKNARTDVADDDVALDLIVDGIRENLQFLEGAEKISFRKNIEVKRAVLDKSRLNIILNNLASNAVKYHNVEGPDPWISVTVLLKGSSLVIEVADNGLGISRERQSKIFDMFYRGTERSNGSGLGLYIVKETIEKMNGTIGVESVEGVGTTFTVNLPATLDNIVLQTEPELHLQVV